MSERKSTVGDPIYVESLMSAVEYSEWKKLYPKQVQLDRLTAPFLCDFKWRWRMGESLLPEEIQIITKRINDMLAKAGLKR